MITLDTIWKQFTLSGPTIIKADVQGAELEVLDGAQEVLKYSEVIILETCIFEHYKDNPILEDYIAYMREKGFTVNDIVGGGYSMSTGRLGFIDIAFVKKGGISSSTSCLCLNKFSSRIETIALAGRFS